MLSAMLRSGRLVDYVAIGQDGAPVYKNAEAFRDAVSRISKGGPELSKFLAKPKFNLDYSQVEWYVPFDPSSPDGQYRIVGWKNAREDERAQALRQLKDFGTVLENFGEELLSGRPDKNTLLFAHYLTGQGTSSRLPAIHFPGPDYIYLVDGQPVLTFWGFLEQGGKIGLDPFACLKPKAAVPPAVPPVPPAAPAAAAAPVPPPAAAAPVPPPAAAAAAEKPCRKLWAWLLGLGWWWLLLIPLLLLLLYTLWWLLFGRGFAWNEFCNVARAPFQHEVVVQEEPALNLEEPGVVVKRPDVVYEGGNAVLEGTDAALPGGSLELNGGDISGTGPELTGGELPLNGMTPEGGQGEEGAAPAPENQAAEAGAPENESPAPEQLESPAAEPPVPEPEAQNQQTPPAPQAPEAQGELTLPQSAENLGFLEGHWQTRSGMMDTSTGRPLNLSYDYKNNEGELVVERQDKTKCVVKAPPQMQGGRLVIEAQGRAVCPDNSSYTLPRIVCETGADGKAKCQAVYSEENQFPLRMYN